MGKNLLLKSIKGEKIDRFPVWLMRQAGRYLKEYKNLRSKEKDFLSFCKNVGLATKASLLPVELLDVDAVILFSDILVPLEPMGVKVEFKDGDGPVLFWDRDVKNLKRITYKSADFVNDIVRSIKTAVKELPLIGFCGGPFTLLSYMVEGRGNGSFKNTKAFLWRNEDSRRLMSLLVDNLREYLKGQVLAGIDVVQVFDSWTMHLPYEDFEDYARTYLRKLFTDIKREFGIPIIYFYRGSSSFLSVIKELPADVVSVDWTVDMVGEMSKSNKAFQGNLDPQVLYMDEDFIAKKVVELLRCIPRKTKYIFNLGHGLAPDMDFHKVKLLVDTVKAYKLV
ncbi:MAG: uroporphyrinogen decarboxylase [Aquificaceae bacterium]